MSATEGATEASGSITDDDAAPSGVVLGVDPGSVSEDVGEAVTVTVTVTLSGSTTFDADKTVAVTVGARGDTAGSGVDYTAVNGFNITIPAGESSGEATFDLEPVDDGLDEPAETLTVAGTSAGLSVTKTTVTITDDDATPTVSVTDAAAVSEGDDPSKTTDMTFAVSLSATSSRDVTVTYTLGGSAGSPADYTAPTPLSVTIAAGSTSGTITVPVKGGRRTRSRSPSPKPPTVSCRPVRRRLRGRLPMTTPLPLFLSPTPPRFRRVTTRRRPRT